jgi:hypothetical protein
VVDGAAPGALNGLIWWRGFDMVTGDNGDCIDHLYLGAASKKP